MRLSSDISAQGENIFARYDAFKMKSNAVAAQKLSGPCVILCGLCVKEHLNAESAEKDAENAEKRTVFIRSSVTPIPFRSAIDLDQDHRDV